MLISSLIAHVMRSSELILDLYAFSLKKVKAHGMEWLEQLQTGTVELSANAADTSSGS